MMVGRMRQDRQGQTVAIHYHHDLHAFYDLRQTDLGRTALRRHEGGVEEGLALVHDTGLAQLVGQIHQNGAYHLVPTSLLKPAMDRLVVRIALRKHVPLGARH